MASSTAILQKAQEAASREALRTFALRFRQKRPDVNLYSAVVPLKDLLGRRRPTTSRHDNRRGSQRPLTPSRLRQVSTYLREEEGVLPTSLLLCVRQPDHASFEPAGIASGGGDPGLLTSAARERGQSACEEPQGYVIQKALGAGALHQIMPDILEVCRSADDFSQEKIADVFAEIGRSAGFWHSERGHYMVRQSGARYVKALAEYLRARLPRPAPRGRWAARLRARGGPRAPPR